MCEGGEVARWKRWEDNEVGRSKKWEGSEVASWERWDGSEVARWKSWESSVVVEWRFLVLFKCGGRRMGRRFHLFISGVNQRNVGAGCVQDFLVWPQGWKDSP